MKPLPKPLPCPVCGEKPRIINSISIFSWVVICARSKMSSPTFHEVEAAAKTERTAINRWNRMVGR